MSNLNFLSTTIPYVNARPHVGFALELIQADVFARYLRTKGQQVHFQSGSDENSAKCVAAAKFRGLSTREHVDEHAELYRRLCEKLGISIDAFVRTTSPEHHATVHAFWHRLRASDLYVRSYSAQYCVGCEDFLLESDLTDGVCPDHQVAPQLVEEENVFFRLSAYQEQLRRLIDSDQLRITPAFRRKEILNFIDGGLRDISITRLAAKTAWGIEVPGRPDQTVYVWIDALINYVTGVGFDGWTEASRRVHFIGKNVWKFHAVYWPALLLSAGLPLPSEIVIHGFLTEDGRKISKSLGTTIDPATLAASVGSESLRFYLLRRFSAFEDGDFSLAALKSDHNAFLVNGIGNLVSRLLSLAERAGVNATAGPTEPIARGEIDSAIGMFRYDEALKLILDEVNRINAEISSAKPWESVRERETGDRIVAWLAELSRVAAQLEPLLPLTSAEVKRRLSGTIAAGHLFDRL